MQRALLVDLGGTNTRVASLDGQGRIGDPVHFASTELPGLAHALASVHRGEKIAVIALAGQVRGNRAKITNLDFSVDAAQLAADFGFRRVILVNDLVAHGVGVLSDARAISPLGGRTRPSLERGPVAVLAAGTGLGEAVFERSANETLWVRAGEGGHAPFVIGDETAFRYARYLEKLPGVPALPSAEDALAGHGLGRLYRFFAAQPAVREPRAMRADVEAAKDPNKRVVELALADESKAASQALEAYVRFFALEVKTLVLKHLAFGGVVLAGGLAASLRKHWLELGFREAFAGVGPFSDQLAGVPIAVARGAASAIEGCAALAGSRKMLLNASEFGLFVHDAGR